MVSSKKSFTRVLSVFLVVVMLIGILPFMSPVKVHAATQNQLNIAARADYMYNLTWVCQKTISGWKNNYTFYAGQTYRVPYAWPVTAGKWVGYNVSIEDFLAATQNASSVFYTKQSYYTGNSGSYAPYYGNDCSTFVSWCWGLSARQTTSSIVNYSGVNLVGNVNTTNVSNSLQLGDALNYAGSHIVLVSDITYDAAGNVSTIEITEQTPPQLKRTTHTVSSLVSKYGASYKIYRYSGTVPASPAGTTNNPNNYTAPTADLAYGASGSQVSWVQSVLSQMGYTITVDGSYGATTQAIVAQYQTDYGLSATGTVNAETRNALIAWWSDPAGLYQATSNVNMRSGDSTSYGIITTLAAGTQVSVIGFNAAGTWANVVYNGTEGWVSKTYLTFIRKFAYNMTFNTNISTTMAGLTFREGRSFIVPTPPAHPDGTSFRGWQLLRSSDWVWYNGSSWIASQADSKLYSPGEVIKFNDSMLNPKWGDDAYFLCAVWGAETIPEVPAVTPTSVDPSLYGWQWPESESYGYFGNYGGNGQDIELCVDLCLLPSSTESKAVFYTDGTTKNMVITKNAVTVGSTTVDYNWGELSLDNWHDVKFKVMNGMGYVYIDGALIASASGFTANETYQLLFSYPGEMAIDNAMLYRSDGHVFFSTDFENASDASKLMGEGLGARTLIFPDTTPFVISISDTAPSINGTGSITLSATPSAGSGHSYSWSSSNAALNKYITTQGSKCTINIPSELSSALSANITCTVVSDGNVSASASVPFTYTPYPTPSISSVTPASATITDTGTASFTVNASGTGLTYMWTCSDSALNAYLSGTNTAKLTVNIPTALAKELTATFTCTVTNTYGKAVTSSPVTLTYALTPAPAFTVGDINGDELITAADLNLIKRFAVGIYAIEENTPEFFAADINGDGMINSKDISAIMKMLL